MNYDEAVEAEEDGALITDGEYVYKIISHRILAASVPVFTIQRQSLGIPFDGIEVDPITVTNMWRVTDD